MKRWYNWPRHYWSPKGRTLKPWYFIMGTIIGSPLIVVGFGLAYLGVAISSGLYEAEHFRRLNF